MSSIAGSERARSEYAELVALRVPKNNPGLLALSYVHSCGSQREQSLDLGVSVVRSEVEVEAILRRLRLRDPHEKEPRKPIRGGSDLELVGILAHDNPAERARHHSPRARGSRADDRLPTRGSRADRRRLLLGVPTRNRAHLEHIGDLMEAIVATGAVSGELLGEPSAELRANLVDSLVRLFTPFQSM